MKINRYTAAGLTAFALVCASANVQAQNDDFSTFDSGVQGGAPTVTGNGGVTVGTLYDNGTIVWDGTQDDTGNGGGSLLLTANISSGDCCGKPLLEQIGMSYDNWYYNGSGTVDLTKFADLQFAIKWDTNSPITPAQFNTLSNWPLALLPSWNSDPNYLQEQNANGGYTTGIEIDAMTGVNGILIYLTNFSVPDSAANGWQTITLPIDAATTGFNSVVGFVFTKYMSATWPVQGTVAASFWLDNITLVTNVGPVIPPTLSPPAPATPGLNILASTEGNSFYDRQSALFVPDAGLSWVGNPGGAPTYPVSYSLTLDSFPNATTYSTEAYMFLVPNAANLEQAPDYNETNVAILEIESTGNGGVGTFLYKANEAGGAGQNMYFNLAPNTNAPGSWPGPGTVALTNWFEQGNLTNVHSSKLLGTWTLQFNSPENGEIIGPDGSTASFTIPSYYATNFQENGSTSIPFNIYLGMQANNAAAINQAVVYGKFSMTNVGGNFSENFVGETTLNTNNWNPNYATAPAGVLIVPTNAPYWIDWTLPAAGFNLTASSSLGQTANWQNVLTFTPISGVGIDYQLISDNDVSSTNTEFFEMAQDVFSKLLVVLPGQTLSPSSPGGVSGTPTTVSDSDNYGEETITVYAVDSHNNPVSGSADVIAITSATDGDAILPNNMAMNNGVAVFDSSNPFFFYDETGQETVTATDVTNPSITAGTSSQVTVTQ